MLLAFVSAIGALVTMIYCDEMEKIADVETHENDVGFARHTLNAKKSGGKKKKSYKQKAANKKATKRHKRKIKIR